jgi:hypothetical protein
MGIVVIIALISLVANLPGSIVNSLTLFEKLRSRWANRTLLKKSKVPHAKLIIASNFVTACLMFFLMLAVGNVPVREDKLTSPEEVIVLEQHNRPEQVEPIKSVVRTVIESAGFRLENCGELYSSKRTQTRKRKKPHSLPCSNPADLPFKPT